MNPERHIYVVQADDIIKMLRQQPLRMTAKLQCNYNEKLWYYFSDVEMMPIRIVCVGPNFIVVNLMHQNKRRVK